jgi:hypothetical protein
MMTLMCDMDLSEVDYCCCVLVALVALARRDGPFLSQQQLLPGKALLLQH